MNGVMSGVTRAKLNLNPTRAKIRSAYKNLKVILSRLKSF